jgi:hypothetical protein
MEAQGQLQPIQQYSWAGLSKWHSPFLQRLRLRWPLLSRHTIDIPYFWLRPKTHRIHATPLTSLISGSDQRRTAFVRACDITIRHCPTTQLLADSFTKPLQGPLFQYSQWSHPHSTAWGVAVLNIINLFLPITSLQPPTDSHTDAKWLLTSESKDSSFNTPLSNQAPLQLASNAHILLI